MHDLPSQLLLQQQQAKKITGVELETYGKYAAKMFHSGRCDSLADAVIETIKTAALSPEQVKRVVEFTNVNAYLDEFKKEGQSHRYIELRGGPADPGVVLRDLNDGGSPTVVDHNLSDYNFPPPDGKKLAHAARLRLGVPDLLDAVFAEEKAKCSSTTEPYDNPLQDSLRLRTKLAGLYDGLNSDLNTLEYNLMVDKEELYNQVKEACHSGVLLGDVLSAWSVLGNDAEFTKCAFRYITPLLVKEGLYPNALSVATAVGQYTKVASMVNANHPLIKTFGSFCATLEKLAHTRVAADEVVKELDALVTFIKHASALEREATAAANVTTETYLPPWERAEGQEVSVEELASTYPTKQATVGSALGSMAATAARGVGKAWSKAKGVADEAGTAITKGLTPAGEYPGVAARYAGQAARYSPHAAAVVGGGLAAEAAHERLMYGQDPISRTARGVGQHVQAAVLPTSQAGQMRRYRVQSGQ